MMRILARLWASFILAFKHLLAERWLSFAALMGMTAAVVLAVSVPIYADSVYYRVLSQQLANAPSDREVVRAPIELQARKVPSISSGMSWQDLSSLETYMMDIAPDVLDLPLLYAVRHAQTRPFLVFPVDNTSYQDSAESLARLPLAFVSDFESHITIVEGAWPEAAGSGATSMEVLVSEYLANRLGLQVGDELTAIMRDGGTIVATVPVRISGVWIPLDAASSYWFHAPEMLDLMLLVPESTFVQSIVTDLGDSISLALWNLTLDGGNIHTYDVAPLQERIDRVRLRVDKLGGALSQGPAEELKSYRTSVQGMTLQLYTYMLPILGMDLMLLLQVAQLSADRRRNEFSVLRGRGATQRQLVLAAGLEGSILGVLALVLGLILGIQLAALLARTTAFITFTRDIHMRIGLNRTSVWVGAALASCALLLWLLTMARATRETLVEYRQTRFRSLRVPWMRRLGFTVLLLAPAAYGLWQLQQQSAIQNFNPFENPLLFLIPTLVTLSAALVTTYILPVAAAVFAKLLSFTRSTGALLALRQIARQPGVYTMPLVLLISTLSLAVYTSSTAVSLEHQTAVQIEYAVGADLVLYGDDQNAITPGSSGPPAFNMEELPSLKESARWVFRPVEEHLLINGVHAAARVGSYNAVFQTARGSQAARVIGVDRLDFPAVANWREDYADESLGALMNALVTSPDGILLPAQTMRELVLEPGDRINLVVDTGGENTALDFRIVGSFELFPSWQPWVWNATRKDFVYRPLFVCNLDYLFRETGGLFPYDVWLNIDGNAHPATIVSEAQDMQLRVMGWRSTRDDISRAFLDPQRQGVTGMLSVGFIGSAAFTVLSFILYVAFSLRQRAIEVAVLRSLGLGRRALRIWLVVELCIVLVTGMLVGVLTGTYLANLLIPTLQISTPEASIPPVQMVIATQAVTGLGAVMLVVFVISTGVIVWRMVRMRLFASLKLGETL